ncbi:hypothetical protein OEB99_09690 [Actinotalea sp. M2MS4P-6]|uniref:pilus assembly PilX family protein n=1 Tax=Actinotalea sp. M2MS4P-6 TaxID=2983762 RepID=UPI0021E3D790|nr:hypothetical protein [Actinotalea sp. M2MS4P-6]MCV2394577.1 hypothetical protein [Actinotalea sp. M2MS4P-6]
MSILRMRRARRRREADDRGVALVLVIGSAIVIAALLLVGLTYAVQSTRFSRYDQDYTAAMTAAQSGVDDFITRLNRDDNYGRTADCTNSAMVSPTACGLPYGWSPVTPGATDPEDPAFHYTADASGAWTSGTIMLTSTGRVNDVYRTIEVAVGKGGSTDYVYYTDFESADPDNLYAYPSGASTTCGGSGAALAKYWWNGRSTASCVEIQFGSNDDLDGDVFSNDAVLSKGGQFLQGFESANPGCSSVVPTSTSTWANCLRSGSTFTATGTSRTFGEAPAYHALLYLPDNSASFSTTPGCHYYGPTRIILNSDGTMTVWSPESDFAGAVLAVADSSGTTPSCGTGASLSSASGARVPVPSDMAVYVDASPTSGTGAVTRHLMDAGYIDGILPLGTYSSSLVPSSGASYTVQAAMTDPRKYTGEGNLWLQGVMNGRVTFAAAQSIVVTGDVVLAGGPDGTDLVGLVATNSVEVMNPYMYKVSAVSTGGKHSTTYVWGSPAGAGVLSGWPIRIADPAYGRNEPTSGLQIAASIQTLQHSFTVQAYGEGSYRGSLYVRGSIAQRWRGAVGTSSGGTMVSGYGKAYTYDVRLRYTAPPFWPHWVNAEWSLRYSGEVSSSTQPWVP